MLSLFVYQQPAVSHLCISYLFASMSIAVIRAYSCSNCSCAYGCMACMLILHRCTHAPIHSNPFVCVITTIELSMVITTCSCRVLLASLKAKARPTFGFTYLVIACCLFLAHICAYMALAGSDRFLEFGVHEHPS